MLAMASIRQANSSIEGAGHFKYARSAVNLSTRLGLLEDGGAHVPIKRPGHAVDAQQSGPEELYSCQYCCAGHRPQDVLHFSEPDHTLASASSCARFCASSNSWMIFL